MDIQQSKEAIKNMKWFLLILGVSILMAFISAISVIGTTKDWEFFEKTNLLWFLGVDVFCVVGIRLKIEIWRVKNYQKNLKNKLTTDYQKVKIDFSSNNKFLEKFYKDNIIETFAKIHPLDSSKIIVKIAFEGERNIKAKREILFDMSEIEFL